MNRGVIYHQLRRATCDGSGDQFRGYSDDEIQIWNKGARVVANTNIYLSSKVLSNLLDSFEDQGNEKISGSSKAGLVRSLGEHQLAGNLQVRTKGRTARTGGISVTDSGQSDEK